MLNPSTWGTDATIITPHAMIYAFAPARSDEEQFSMSQLNTLDLNVPTTTEWMLPDCEIVRILVESFRQVPQVASICAQFSTDGIAIWTLLTEYDRDARQAVYEKELELCSVLGSCDFDFRVSSVDLVNPKELVAAGSREIFARS
jgi:hypothetical protein